MPEYDPMFVTFHEWSGHILNFHYHRWEMMPWQIPDSLSAHISQDSTRWNRPMLVITFGYYSSWLDKMRTFSCHWHLNIYTINWSIYSKCKIGVVHLLYHDVKETPIWIGQEWPRIVGQSTWTYVWYFWKRHRPILAQFYENRFWCGSPQNSSVAPFLAVDTLQYQTGVLNTVKTFNCRTGNRSCRLSSPPSSNPYGTTQPILSLGHPFIDKRTTRHSNFLNWPWTLG